VSKEHQGPPPEPPRHRLPQDRESVTLGFTITGRGYDGRAKDYKGFVTAGLYPDGSVGELFVRFAKMGGRQGALLDSWAQAVSRQLQTGTSLEDVVEAYEFVGFPPAGMSSGHPGIHIVKSPLDFVAKWLRLRFLPPEEEAEEETS